MNEMLRGSDDKRNPRAPASAPRCDRAEDLVAYLYGETAPAEAERFTRHLSACGACRDELAAFGAVRESVGEWRSAALDAAPSIAFDPAPFSEAAHEVAPGAFNPRPAGRERSAVAALREFFALSPRWLQAASVAATVLVCALTALVAAGTEVRWDAGGLAFRAGVRERTVERIVEKRVEVPAPTGLTQGQVDALVAERVAAARLQSEAEKEAAIAAALAEAKKSAPRAVAVSAQATRQARRERPGPGGSQRQRQNLARFEKDEDYLPRFSDLLNVVN